MPESTAGPATGSARASATPVAHRRAPGVAAGFAVLAGVLLAGCGGTARPSSPSPPVALVVTPPGQAIAPGERLKLAAVVRRADGSVTDVTRRAAWRSSATRVARVGRDGVVVGQSAGTATIRTTLGRRVATASIRVGALRMGPLRASRANPRYFADPSGRIVYLTGDHTWADLVDSGPADPPPRFDYARFLDGLQAHGVNLTELWAWEQAFSAPWIPGPYTFAPLVYERTGPGTALDGRPKFDLSRFNPAYFQRLRDRVAAARQRGIYTLVMLFDGWSIEQKDKRLLSPWGGHPFNRANNVNGIDGDPNNDGSGTETHRLEVAAVTRLQDAYVRRVVDVLGDQPNVLYEVSNESRQGSLPWQEHIVKVIRDEERTGRRARHPVGITAEVPGGENADLFTTSADWIAPNGSVDDPTPGDGRKVVIYDTDHLCGICGDGSWPWRSFTRGLNPQLMDLYDGQATGLGAEGWDAADPRWEDARRALGITEEVSRRVELARMVPRGELASSGYCLANASPGGEYLAYSPKGGELTVDLSSTPGRMRATWIDAVSGEAHPGGSVSGGAKVRLRAPFRGPAALILRAAPSGP